MNKYELMFIINPNLAKEEITKVISDVEKVFPNLGGKVTDIKERGFKDLAYEINKLRKGYYVELKVEANGEIIKEFERVCRINDNIIRFISVKE